MDRYDLGAGLLGGLQQGLNTYLQTSTEREKRKRDEAFQLAKMKAEGFDVSETPEGQFDIKRSQGYLDKEKREGLLAARKEGLIPIYDEAGNVADYKVDLEMLRAKKPEFGMPQLTKGQEAADTAFGKEYADYQAGGGKAGIEKNIGLLSGAVENLKSGKAKTGGWTTKIPGLSSDVVQEALNPEMIAARDSIRGAIQNTLRQTLGPQFTEKEGTDIFNRAFNPRLSPQENIRRAEAVIQELQTRIDAKDKSVRQFEQAGTLRGMGLIQPQGAEAMPKGPQGKVRVTNGKETLLIDSADLQEAIADGYRQAP